MAGSIHEHGYSAGPVYGFLSNFAQVSDDRPVDPDFKEAKGFGAEGVDDGYDPYGYGDFGYGYGAAQTQYKEIQEKLNAMQAAYEQFEDSAANRKGAGRVASSGRNQEALDALQAAMDAKWSYMNAAIDAQNKAWEATKAARTATMEAAVEDARKKIA